MPPIHSYHARPCAGLVGAILGLEDLPAEARCGLRLLTAVATVAQELSLHGKKWIGTGPNESFHRPTSVELVVNPHYRAFYAGPRSEDLASRLQARQSHYHTYLGSAFLPDFPRIRRGEAGRADPDRRPPDCLHHRCPPGSGWETAL